MQHRHMVYIYLGCLHPAVLWWDHTSSITLLQTCPAYPSIPPSFTLLLLGWSWTKITCKPADMLHHSNSNGFFVIQSVSAFFDTAVCGYCYALGLAMMKYIIQWRTSYKNRIGLLLSHCGMRVASSERIKRLAWKGKELAERLMTQAWVTFYGCYKIKIDWFGSQVLSFLFPLFMFMSPV